MTRHYLLAAALTLLTLNASAQQAVSIQPLQYRIDQQASAPRKVAAGLAKYTPETPMVAGLDEYDATNEQGGLGFYISYYNILGDSLDVNKIYYNVFIEDMEHPYTLTPDIYLAAEEDMTDIPYGYAAINTAITYLEDQNCFYLPFYEDVQYIGIQTIYRDGDIEIKSDLLVADLVEMSISTTIQLDDVAATPADPQFIGLNPYDATNGYGAIGYNIPLASTDGYALRQDKLFYNIFYDDDPTPFVLTSTDYPVLGENVTDVPVYFDAVYYMPIINAGDYYMFYHLKDADKIGLQSIYRGGGEEHKSDLLWLDLHTAQVIPSSIQTTKASQSPIVSTTYYNLAGQRIEQPASGIYIQTTRRADGTQQSTKLLR